MRKLSSNLTVLYPADRSPSKYKGMISLLTRGLDGTLGVSGNSSWCLKAFHVSNQERANKTPRETYPLLRALFPNLVPEGTCGHSQGVQGGFFWGRLLLMVSEASCSSCGLRPFSSLGCGDGQCHHALLQRGTKPTRKERTRRAGSSYRSCGKRNCKADWELARDNRDIPTSLSSLTLWGRRRRRRSQSLH